MTKDVRKKQGLPTDEELIECISRSGYLFESDLVKHLVANGFFVEPSQVLADPRTGKSREIDILAEFYDAKRPVNRQHVTVKTIFVIEAINNTFPFVLITPRPNTPNQLFPVPMKYSASNDQAAQSVDWFEKKYRSTDDLYSQYCSISVKGNGDLMASHSDDVYGSLLKMAEYIEEEVERTDTSQSGSDPEGDSILIFWQAILVLKHELRVLETNQRGGVLLRQVEYGRFEFNWHSANKPRRTYVEVMTASHLLKYLSQVVDEDNEIAEMVEEEWLSIKLSGRDSPKKL